MSTKKLQVLDYKIKQAENADTIDGKHAIDFATATEMNAAQSNISDLQTKVGDTLVADQITNAIANKVDKVDGKGLSTNDYTTAEKNKLAGIATGATKITVDSTLLSGSTNPVQNRVVNNAILQLYSAISAAIPSVTAADNGKFMTVVNGAWAAETVPNAEEASF